MAYLTTFSSRTDMYRVTTIKPKTTSHRYNLEITRRHRQANSTRFRTCGTRFLLHSPVRTHTRTVKPASEGEFMPHKYSLLAAYTGEPKRGSRALSVAPVGIWRRHEGIPRRNRSRARRKARDERMGGIEERESLHLLPDFPSDADA